MTGGACTQSSLHLAGGRLRAAPGAIALAVLLALPSAARAQSPTLNGSRETFAANCNGGDALINGNRNEVTLKGFCRDVTIRGNDNHVLAEMTSQGRIMVPGSGNRVDYRIPAGGLPPQLSVQGNNNQVQRVPGDSETPQSGVAEPRDTGRIRQP